MGNADVEDADASRTFWRAAHDVMTEITWVQGITVVMLLLLALGLRRGAKSDFSSLRILVGAIFASFFVWPLVLQVYLHLHLPTGFPQWVAPPSLSLKGFILIAIMSNQAALLAAGLCIPMWLLAAKLSSRKFGTGYLTVLGVLPLAWFLDCFSELPH